MMPIAPFEYTPLKRQTRSIRLLRFIDGGRIPTAPHVSCVMETFELARCPPFVALSYTWGNPSLCREISVNGKPLYIRENIYQAMSVLQHLPATQVSEDPRRERELIRGHFWVDAVCINQNDVLERGHQVSLMESIFTGAACAIAWLGPEAEKSKVAMDAIRSQFKSYAGRADLGGGPQTRWKYWLLRSALHRLSFRPYWGRMWTVQEFILPKNLLLLCGENGTWWENFLAAKPAIAEMQLLQSGWLRLWDARDRWQRSNAHRDRVVDAVAEEVGDAIVGHMPDSGTMSALTAADSLDELLFVFGYGQCSNPARSDLCSPVSGPTPRVAKSQTSPTGLHYFCGAALLSRPCSSQILAFARRQQILDRLPRCIVPSIGIGQRRGIFPTTRYFI